MHIKLTSVIVDDQDKALRFYTEVLGFRKKTEVPMGAHKWITVVDPESPGEVELALEPNEHPAAKAFQKGLFDSNIPLTSFFTKDVQKESERLSALGVKFRTPPTQAEFGHYAVFEDTCGNLIQLHQA